MALTLRNTLSGELEAFEPQGSTVTLYNCGPTVYDRQHIGNLRGAILANTLRRALEASGYKVTHVSNITDVGHLVADQDEGEDKVEKQAREERSAVSGQRTAISGQRLVLTPACRAESTPLPRSGRGTEGEG